MVWYQAVNGYLPRSRRISERPVDDGLGQVHVSQCFSVGGVQHQSNILAEPCGDHQCLFDRFHLGHGEDGVGGVLGRAIEAVTHVDHLCDAITERVTAHDALPVVGYRVRVPSAARWMTAIRAYPGTSSVL